MRESKIGLLTLQETHLNDEHLEEIKNLFGRQLEVFNSADPEHPSGKGGVAIVLHKAFTNIKGIEVKEIIPGRALLLRHPWHDNKIFTFLAIYAPAGSNQEKIDFWNELSTRWDQRRLPNLDGFGGDLNMVEETVDRLSGRRENTGVTKAFCDFRRKFTLIDGWRDFHTQEKDYTFVQQSNGSRSRIDRIYTTSQILENSRDWEITDSPITTDHKLISTTIVDPRMPLIGDGRWVIPQIVLKSKEYIKQVNEMGLKLEQKLDELDAGNISSEDVSRQTFYKEFKDQCRFVARKIAKKIVPRAKLKIEELGKERKSILNDDKLTKEEKIVKVNDLDEGIQKLHISLHVDNRKVCRANAHLNSEKPTRYWSKMKEPPKPRDYMTSLAYPATEPRRYTTDSDIMVNIANNYHNELQNEAPNHGINKEDARREVLQNVNGH
ncbi:DNase I-like protein, partial [Dendrothele bispora CBS 962.96]